MQTTTPRPHKIRGVPLDVCAAEQKIAYNLAFVRYDCIRSRSSADPVAECMRLWRLSSGYDPRRYSDDLIATALRAGLPAYLRSPAIYSSFEGIGRAFPPAAPRGGDRMTYPQALDTLDRIRDRRAYRAACQLRASRAVEREEQKAEKEALAVFWAMEHTKNAFLQMARV